MDDIVAMHEEVFETRLDLSIYEKGLIFRRSDEGLVGYVLFQAVDGFADLHYIAVAPTLRGHGHGARLLDIFLEHMESAGISAVTLEVRSDNVAAIKLYESFDFECIHVRKGYYKDGADALLMKIEFDVGC